MSIGTNLHTVFSFSTHIPYGKGKYFNQTVFKQILPSIKIIFNFKGVTNRIQLT